MQAHSGQYRGIAQFMIRTERQRSGKTKFLRLPPEFAGRNVGKFLNSVPLQRVSLLTRMIRLEH
jgi:hypothetical protein